MSSQITRILNRIAEGHAGAIDELVPLVYEQMRRIAASAASREPAAASDPTELVHEAYMRMVGDEKLGWKDRSHFFGACATVIRRILVDQARARKRVKRGGEFSRVELSEHVLPEPDSLDLVELDEALQELESLSPRQAHLIELRYFGGLTETEVAEIMNVSRRTVSGDWGMAKAWLRTRLS